MARLVAVATDCDDRPSPLAIPHIRYYAPAVDQYLLVLQGRGADAAAYREHLRAEVPAEVLSRVLVLSSGDLRPAFSGQGPNLFDGRKDHYEKVALDRQGVDSRDFVLHLDLDEFHLYPVPVRQVVQIMTKCNWPAVMGCIRDRLVLNAEQTRVVLREVDPRTDLGPQFPWCAAYSRDLIRPASPCDQKVMIARGDVTLGPGRHHIRFPDGSIDYSAAEAARRVEDLGPGWDRDCFQVHHFRWTNRLCGLMERVMTWPEFDLNYVNEVECLRKLRCEGDTLFFHPYFLRNPDGDLCLAGSLPSRGLSYSP